MYEEKVKMTLLRHKQKLARAEILHKQELERVKLVHKLEREQNFAILAEKMDAMIHNINILGDRFESKGMIEILVDEIELVEESTERYVI